MATRAISKPQPDWRAAFRRSLRRAGQMTGAAVLFGLMLFLGLALFSYTQTDPSPSTAAGNWRDCATGWARAARGRQNASWFLFGLSGVLILPMLYVFARKLWRDVEEEDRDTDTRWWQPIAMLVLAMALLSTVLSLTFDGLGDGPSGSMPASSGGLTGLLGAGAIEAVAARFGEGASGLDYAGAGPAGAGRRRYAGHPRLCASTGAHC